MRTIFLFFAMVASLTAESAPAFYAQVIRFKTVPMDGKPSLKMRISLDNSTFDISYTDLDEKGADRGANPRNVWIEIADLDKLSALMKKFLEWSSKAREIDAETFNKALGSLPSDPNKSIDFAWNKDSKAAILMPYKLSEGVVKETLSIFDNELEVLRKELREKQQKLEAQDKLFK